MNLLNFVRELYHVTVAVASVKDSFIDTILRSQDSSEKIRGRKRVFCAHIDALQEGVKLFDSLRVMP